MNKLTVEWDQSWDDEWQAALQTIEEEMEEERPLDAEQAIELYQYGFSAARRHPLRGWPEVESELYQDYMSGSPEQGENEDEEWEQVREWTRRGWESSRS